MSADADITKYESQMLRALHSRICPQVFAIRAIALLAHTCGGAKCLCLLLRERIAGLSAWLTFIVIGLQNLVAI